MLTGRDQWYHEGQPVQRHLRDFEDKNVSAGIAELCFCLFVSPRLHRDTLNTFWTAVRYEYEGVAQRIIPMSITQLIMLLQKVKRCKESGRAVRHTDLLALFTSATNTASLRSATEWEAHIHAEIEKFCSK